MKLPQRIDTIVFIVVILFALRFGYNTIYKGGLGKINSIKSQIKNEKEKREIAVMIGLLDKRIKAYQKRTFPKEESTQLLNDISDLTKELQLEIESYSPLTTIYKDAYAVFSLKINLSCKYHQLGQLLSLIESNEKFLWVKALNIKETSVPGAKRRGIPKVDLAISGLYLEQ